MFESLSPLIAKQLPYAGNLGSGTVGLNSDYLTIPGGLGADVAKPMNLMPDAAKVVMGNDRQLSGFEPGWLDRLTGWSNPDGTKVNGWGGPALGLAQAGLGAYMGLQQLKVAKASLAEGKRQFDMNYGAQRQTTNTALEDRQRARVASNEGAYESVGSYMARNGIR